MASYNGLAYLIILMLTPIIYADHRCADGSPIEECAERFGETPENYKIMCGKALEAKKMMAKALGVKFDEKAKGADTPIMGDIVMDTQFSEAYMKAMEKDAKDGKKPDHHRTKRTAFINLEQKYEFRWHDLYIRYDFMNIERPNRKIIKRAIKEIQRNTCVRFKRADHLSSADLVFVDSPSVVGCLSTVGRRPLLDPQFIYLSKSRGCFRSVGVPLHEIVHALGSWHEQNRNDRNLYITVHPDNIDTSIPYVTGAFEQRPDDFFLDPRGLPYDYSSIMQYGPNSFQKDRSRPTITTNDPRFMSTIGQESELSFYDAKIINLNYCRKCDSDFESNCRYDGYKIRPKCKCVCPDGLGGKDCSKPKGHSSGCKPEKKRLTASRDFHQCVTSPGYGKKGYTPGDRCTWMIRAPFEGPNDPHCHIRIWLNDTLGIPQRGTICDDWVEIRPDGIHLPGFRVCGNTVPKEFRYDAALESDQRFALVTFRSFLNADKSNTGKEKGFQLCFALDICD